MSKKLTFDKFVTRSHLIHGKKYDYSKANYVNNRTNISILCPIHGEFLQTPEKHMIGRGCQECGGSKKWDINRFIREAKKIHGEKYDYGQSNYINGITPLKIICYIHGEFLQTPGNHLSGKNCQKCIGNIKSNTEKFILKSHKIHNNKYQYLKTIYGKNNEEKVIITCPIHGNFFQAPYHHLSGQGCVKCTSNISNKERKFLDTIKIPDTKTNRQKRILRFNVDGIDLDTNTVYEFLGDFYHGNPKKFKHNSYNKLCHKTFGQLYENTFKKFKILKDNGYKVKYIWEDDWDIWNCGDIDSIPIKEYK